jgi:methylated-DNA-[protein]-cysteine S-methyltransferase
VLLARRTIPSPIGNWHLFADATALVGCYSDSHRDALPVAESAQNAILDSTETQLSEYFSGERKSFDLPLSPQGTLFQRQVWAMLVTIPFGETCSYGELAKKLGDSKLSRAVGAANGANPISIIVPCHRVIASTGHLTGYAGGVEIKKFLLDFESADASLFGNLL